MTKDDLPSTIQSLLRIPSSATNSHSISELPYEYPPLFYKIRVRDGSLKIIKNSLIDNKEVEVNSTEFKNKKKYLWLLSDSCDLLLCEEVFITEKNRFIKHRDLCNSKNQEGFAKHGGQILICENFIFVDDQSGFVLNRKNRIRSTANPYICIISHLFSNIFKKPVIYRSTVGSENYNIIEREIFELEQITSKIKIKTEDDSNMLDNESDESECLLTDDEIPEILKNFKLDDDVIFSTLCYNCFDTLGNLLLQKDFDQNISSDERMEKHARDNLLALLQTNWKKNVWVKLFNYFRTKKLESINYVSKAAPLVVLKNIILTKKYLNNNFVFDKNKYLIFKGLDDCLFINRNSILLKLTNEEADNNNSIFFGIEEKIIDENFMEYKNIRETEIHVYLRNIKLSEKKKKILDIIRIKRLSRGRIAPKKQTFNPDKLLNKRAQKKIRKNKTCVNINLTKKNKDEKIDLSKKKEDVFINDSEDEEVCITNCMDVFNVTLKGFRKDELPNSRLRQREKKNYADDYVCFVCNNCKNDWVEFGKGALVQESIILKFYCPTCRKAGFSHVYNNSVNNSEICPICLLHSELSCSDYKINGTAVECDSCGFFFHSSCLKLTKEELNRIKRTSKFCCVLCFEEKKNENFNREEFLKINLS